MKKTSTCVFRSKPWAIPWAIAWVLAAMLIGPRAAAGESSVTGQGQGQGRPDDLSQEEEETALKLLDDICGDTWCEGSYTWTFEELACSFSKGSCTLLLEAVEAGGNVPGSEPLVCHLEGLGGYGDMVDDSGSYPSLVWAFYESVGACIEEFEAARS